MGIKEFDVFVIGTGTAGKGVAKNCAKEGLKVAIADNREYGGTCATRGCDPKKVLVGLTEIIDRAKKMQGKGITSMPGKSWKDLMAYKESFVNTVPAATEKDLKALGIELYHQSPKFLDENTLSVEGKTVKAKKIVIATGNKPLDLKIPGAEHALISDDFLSLKKLPESMIFIGAGYVGMEFAHIAARFGVKVTMIDVAPRILTNFDEDMVTHLQKASEELGIEFIFNAEAAEIEKLRKNFRLKAKQNGKEISLKAEMIINSAGRVPSIDQLELEKGNVAFGKKGIEVNEYLQNTSNKNVYACGDVSASDGLPLTPLSSQEARIVSANLLHKNKPEKANFPPQPSVVFTLPNLASVGLSEKEAKEKGYNIRVNNKLATKWFNAKRINEKVYAFKTIIDKDSGKILGAHLAGPEASEMINVFVLAMCGGLDCETIKRMIFAYPTWGSDLKSML
ncbi:dihydrolipoyl dehydrogenase family protein [Salegentibacter chungangensis]|uniref:Dihydrolipoyl dehydrogenase n=1 Tax=Salegentibacter chungangensis TaxID=1335724 RepID=A0ABW3NPJ9_9FLAO